MGCPVEGSMGGDDVFESMSSKGLFGRAAPIGRPARKGVVQDRPHVDVGRWADSAGRGGLLWHMYANVPNSVPTSVRVELPSSRSRPKSVILGWPSRSGSRWRASNRGGPPRGHAMVDGPGELLHQGGRLLRTLRGARHGLRQSLPFHIFKRQKISPSCSPGSKIWTRLGCWHFAAAAAALKALAVCGTSSDPRCKILSATRLLRTGPRAR